MFAAWTESIAVGSKGFVQGVLQKFERQMIGRKVREGVDHYELREQGAAYNVRFTPENGLLSGGNAFYWNQ